MGILCTYIYPTEGPALSPKTPPTTVSFLQADMCLTCCTVLNGETHNAIANDNLGRIPAYNTITNDSSSPHLIALAAHISHQRSMCDITVLLLQCKFSWRFCLESASLLLCPLLFLSSGLYHQGFHSAVKCNYSPDAELKNKNKKTTTKNNTSNSQSTGLQLVHTVSVT